MIYFYVQFLSYYYNSILHAIILIGLIIILGSIITRLETYTCMVWWQCCSFNLKFIDYILIFNILGNKWNPYPKMFTKYAVSTECNLPHREQDNVMAALRCTCTLPTILFEEKNSKNSINIVVLFDSLNLKGFDQLLNSAVIWVTCLLWTKKICCPPPRARVVLLLNRSREVSFCWSY